MKFETIKIGSIWITKLYISRGHTAHIMSVKSYYSSYVQICMTTMQIRQENELGSEQNLLICIKFQRPSNLLLLSLLIFNQFQTLTHKNSMTSSCLHDFITLSFT